GSGWGSQGGQRFGGGSDMGRSYEQRFGSSFGRSGSEYGQGGGSQPGAGYGWGGGYGSSGFSGWSEESNRGRQSEYGGRQSFAGRGPKDYQRSDERIREDISDRFTDDHMLDASGITVQVQGGEVTLSGTVTDRDQKRRAEDMAESCSGVKDVTNHIRVERTQQSGSSQISQTQGKDRDSSSSASKTRSSGITS